MIKFANCYFCSTNVIFFSTHAIFCNTNANLCCTNAILCSTNAIFCSTMLFFAVQCYFLQYKLYFLVCSTHFLVMRKFFWTRSTNFCCIMVQVLPPYRVSFATFRRKFCSVLPSYVKFLKCSKKACSIFLGGGDKSLSMDSMLLIKKPNKVSWRLEFHLEILS
jgi:hypothetical protein